MLVVNIDIAAPNPAEAIYDEDGPVTLIRVIKPASRQKFWKARSILPWVFRPLAWIYLFLVCAMSVALVLAFGIGFPTDATTRNWLVDSFSGVFCDVFIVDPLKIILHATVTILFAGLFEQIFASVASFVSV